MSCSTHWIPDDTQQAQISGASGSPCGIAQPDCSVAEAMQPQWRNLHIQQIYVDIPKRYEEAGAVEGEIPNFEAHYM